MAIDSLQALVEAPRRRLDVLKQNSGSVAAGGSVWRSALPAAGYPLQGAVPATAGAGGTSYSRSSDGAIAIPADRQHLASLRAAGNSNTETLLLLVDRLVACSGLAMNTTSPQSVTLPALPRHTDGHGVLAGLEIYTAPAGATASFALDYTDQNGNPSTTPLLVDPFTSTSSAVAAFRTMPLAAGDSGVRTVTGLTLNSTFGTVGDLGVVLFKPIAFLHAGDPTSLALRMKPRDWLDICLAGIEDGACLSWLHLQSTASGNQMRLRAEVIPA